jgi:RecB family exonuclease
VLPFTLYIGDGLSVEGRMDAIFEREDGIWEVVDYKTGGGEPDPLQLAIYGQAVKAIWGRSPECVWLLLRDGQERKPEEAAGLGALLVESARALRAFQT